MEITNDEVVNRMDIKDTAGSTIGFSLPPRFYLEVVKFSFLLKSLIPNDVKVKVTIEGIRLRSNLTTEKHNEIQ